MTLIFSYENYLNLKQKINKLNHAYYTLDKPIATDNEWDTLYAELLKMEELNPSWITADSPSQRVGGDILDGFIKAPHTILPLSLDKAQNHERLQKFFADIFKELGRAFKVTLELKFDGLSIFIRYENGVYVQARTRGKDGVGEDVTEQVRTIKSIPMTISFTGVLETQAEIFMPKHRLNELNEELQVKFDKEIAAIKSTGREPSKEEIEKLQNVYKLFNERNVASGSVRQLDPKVTASRKLDAFFYNVVISEGKEFETQEEMRQFLIEQQFKVNEYFYVLDSYEEAIEKLEEIKELRPNLNFAIDGAVFKVNEVDIREDIGYTAKFPKYAIAYKFDALEATTTLEEIINEVGRTGKITPKGIVTETDFEGVMVKRVTLNNYGDILRKGLLLGGELFLRRSNDVIPEALGAVPGTIGEEIIQPTHCPSCNSILVEIGALLYCKNHSECPAQSVRKFSHFVSREAMNIEGLSEQTLIKLLDAELINKFSDLYFLKKEDIAQLEGFGDKSAQNLLDSIEESKKRPVKSFLTALGIKNVGKSKSEDLISNFKSIDALSEATFEEIQSIDGFGDKVSQNVVDFFHNEENQKELEIFRSLGIEFESKEEAPKEGLKYSGLTFVITGTLTKLNMSRNEVAAYIVENGGEVDKDITQRTDYLVIGEKAGSKKAKAEKKNIKILTEEELMNFGQ
ncbi:NAD-dependent DNA ligase LigA [Bacillus cereus]